MQEEQKKKADEALGWGIFTSVLVLLSTLIPFLWAWIFWFFFIPLIGIAKGIGAIKSKDISAKVKAICGILLCVLPFVALIPFQIKDNEFINTLEFEEMEDFQFYKNTLDDDGDEYLQLNHRLLIYSGNRDDCNYASCIGFAVDKNNKLFEVYEYSIDTAPVTIKKRAGRKAVLIEKTRTKKCFIFGLYCPKEESILNGKYDYDWTYHTTLYLPETIQVKIYPNSCTDADRYKSGYINPDKKDCAMDENNYIFRNAYEYYK